MTQEDKDLLIKDLCGRLPYGVKVWNEGDVFNIDHISSTYEEIHLDIADNYTIDVSEVKPYLFPMSSMTEEQIEEAKTYFWKDVDYGKNLVDKGINCFYPCFNILEFYHKYHIDYRGLIPKGLAVDCTNLNIY